MAINQQIGSGAIVLTTSADGLVTGLNQAERDVKAWGARTSESVKTGPLGKGAAGGGLFGSLMKGGAIGAGLALGSAAVGGIIGLAETALEKFHSLGEGIDRASKAARALGTDMGTFQGFAHAADLSGISVDELEAGLGRFRRQVDGPLDAALYGFAERLEGITDPGERARMLVEAFGKSGLKLAGMFEGGKAGLQDMVAEAHRLGIALSDADGKAIEEANDSISRAKRSIDGLWNKVVVALAPGLEKAGTFFTNMAVKMQPFFDWASRWLSTQIELWGGLLDVVSSGVSEIVMGIAEWAGELLGISMNELPTIEEVVKGAWRAIGITGAYAFDIIAAGMGLAAVGASKLVEGFGLVVDAFKDIVSLAKRLPESMQPAGLDDFINGVERLKKGTGDVSKGLDDWGKKQIDNLINEKSAKRVREWFDNLGKKKPAEPPKPAPLDLAPSASTGSKLAGAIEAGTKEAYEMTLRTRGFEVGDRERIARDQLAEQRNANKIAEKSDEKLGRLAAAWEGGF